MREGTSMVAGGGVANHRDTWVLEGSQPALLKDQHYEATINDTSADEGI